eukprot:g25699.t1
MRLPLPLAFVKPATNKSKAKPAAKQDQPKGGKNEREKRARARSLLSKELAKGQVGKRAKKSSGKLRSGEDATGSWGEGDEIESIEEEGDKQAPPSSSLPLPSSE